MFACYLGYFPLFTKGIPGCFPCSTLLANSSPGSNYESHKNISLRIDNKYPLNLLRKLHHVSFIPSVLTLYYIRQAMKRIQEDMNKFYASIPCVDDIFWSVSLAQFQWFPNRFYITLLDAPVDIDVTELFVFVGFSKASIMSWCKSICFLWSALLAVWNILSSPISCKSFKVSALTICIVGASDALSSFPFSSVRFERFPDAFFDGAFSLGELSSSRRRDGKHPIMLSLKHSLI